MRSPGTSGAYVTPQPRKSTRIEPVERRVIGQTVFGKYTLTRFLGEGSNSRVFLAQSLASSTPVVVKVVKEHLLANPRFQQFFDGEVRSMARFAHPYAVRLLDASLDEPLGPCLVLEYIPGITLEALLAQQPRLQFERIARLLGPFCHALQAAHDAGIVHRDLKPANLMVVDVDTPLESIRVMDFGFAGFTAKPHIQLAELTGHGAIFACGTPAYVSPEMVRADSVDARADLYAVGVILYEMLTGRLPFECETQEEMLAAHVQSAPPRFHRIGRSDISPAVEGVVQIALSKYPNERQQSAREIAEQFGRALGFDLWSETAPEGYVPPEDDIVECVLAVDAPPVGPEDQFLLSDRFEAMLPERLAAAKLRGFIEDVRGVAVASEPGLIRVRLDLPSGWVEPSDQKPKGSAILSWLSGNRQVPIVRGKEPIEVDLQMHKLDPNRVAVIVEFRPLKWHLPDDVRGWKTRCEEVYSVLRKYLMAA